MQTFSNPFIADYSPDPSICRVGSDFYLVNSADEFYPGVPIYHSKNWWIGHWLIIFLPKIRN